MFLGIVDKRDVILHHHVLGMHWLPLCHQSKPNISVFHKILHQVVLPATLSFIQGQATGATRHASVCHCVFALFMFLHHDPPLSIVQTSQTMPWECTSFVSPPLVYPGQNQQCLGGKDILESWMIVEIYWLLFLHLLSWFLYFLLLPYVIYIELLRLSHPRVSGTNPSGAWCMVFLMCKFSSALRIFAFMFPEETGLKFVCVVCVCVFDIRTVLPSQKRLQCFHFFQCFVIAWDN